jgi:hypothetical protein
MIVLAALVEDDGSYTTELLRAHGGKIEDIRRMMQGEGQG